MRWLLLALLAIGGLAAAMLAARNALFEDEIVLAVMDGRPADWRALRITAEEWETHCPKEAASYTAEGEATSARLDHLWRKADQSFAACRTFPWRGARRIWTDRRPRAKSDHCSADVQRLRPHSIFYESGDRTWILRLLRSHVLPGGKQVLVKPPKCREAKPVRVELARRFRDGMCTCKDAACVAEKDRLYAQRREAASRARAPDEAMQMQIAALNTEAEACRAAVR